jgi:hypothetical protein
MTDDIDNDGTTLHESGGVVQPTDAQTALAERLKLAPHFLSPHAAYAVAKTAVLALAVPQAPLQAEPVPVVASEQVIQDFAAWAAPHLDGSYIRHWVTRFRNALATPQAEPAVAEQERPVNPHHDYLARYWRMGYDGELLGACTGDAPLRAWNEGKRTALASQSTPPSSR